MLRDFKVGQAVWLHDPARRVGVCSKLSDKWKGPYLVTRKLDDLLYLVKRSPKQPAKAFHVDRLLPYRGRNLTPWIVKMAKSAVQCIILFQYHRACVGTSRYVNIIHQTEDMYLLF